MAQKVRRKRTLVKFALQNTTELVSGRCPGQGWNFQLRDQARYLQGFGKPSVMDTGGDRFGNHVEVSFHYPERG